MNESSKSTSAPRAAESWASIWSRRAISVPGYFVLAAICFAGAPLWLPGAMAADVATGRAGMWPRTRALCFLSLYVGCEVVGVLVALLLGAATLGGRIGGAGRYLQANAALQRWWTRSLFQGFVRLFAMRVEVQGLELARRGPMILFVRHTSAADTVLAAALVANPHRLLLRYVLKRELLWDPCLDIVGRRLPNAFIDRAAPKHLRETKAISQLGQDLGEGAAVLIYPEGTRFSQAKLARAVAELRDSGQDSLAAIASSFRHVLPPRLGGPLALLQAAPHADVVVLEHTGFEGTATLASFWRGALVGQTIRVRLRRIAATAIPAKDRDSWLFEQWREMDDWIAGSGASGGRQT